MQLLAFLLEHLRADRHLQHRVGAASARPVLAHAVYAGLGLEMLLIAKVDQRVEAAGAFNDDVAAAAAVAAVGPAELDELLAPEGDATGAAVAGADKTRADREISWPPLVCTLPRSADGCCRLRTPASTQTGRVRLKRSHSTRPPRAGAP